MSDKPKKLDHTGKMTRICQELKSQQDDKKVFLEDLNEILEIDTKNKICIAEPGVTFSDLVLKTLKMGLVPCLVPELKTMTLGGAVSGFSVESMSYKYGGFHDSCIEYEIITSRGEVLICSASKNQDVFHMIHSSYGTLGIISKLKFRLIEAKPFVRMDYKTFPSFAKLSQAITDHCRLKDVDFMDAIVHSPTQAVLCIGTFVDKAPNVSDYTFLDIYYKSTRKKEIDYLTTYDYFFRYDTECHWLSRTIPGMETKLLRLLFGKLLLSSTNLPRWSKKLSPTLKFSKNPDVTVDVFIPKNKIVEFFDFYLEEINYFPLWIVPYRKLQPYPWIHESYEQKISDDLFFDVAIYGLKNRKKNVNYYKLLEEMVYDCHGIKTLTAHNFYEREKFWKIYNRKNWEKVKKRTDPDNRFRDLYEKFHF